VLAAGRIEDWPYVDDTLEDWPLARAIRVASAQFAQIRVPKSQTFMRWSRAADFFWPTGCGKFELVEKEPIIH
jgi:hypothetical protein